jgi:hypothetical protein
MDPLKSPPVQIGAYVILGIAVAPLLWYHLRHRTMTWFAWVMVAFYLPPVVLTWLFMMLLEAYGWRHRNDMTTVSFRRRVRLRAVFATPPGDKPAAVLKPARARILKPRAPASLTHSREGGGGRPATAPRA